MNNEIKKMLEAVITMMAPAKRDYGNTGICNNLRMLSDIPLHSTELPTYAGEIFKSDFSGILGQLNAVFTYYRKNVNTINHATADLNLREVTNFIFGLGILRYMLAAYMYKVGVVNVTFIGNRRKGLIDSIDKILLEYSIFRQVTTIVNRYHKPKIIKISADTTVSVERIGAYTIGKYKAPDHITANDPRTRDHYNCSIFPVLTYLREDDLVLSTYDNYKFLSIKFHKQSKDIATRATKIKGLISDMYSLISSEKNVKAIRLLKEYYPEVDIKELDNILARDVAPKLRLIK